MFCIGSWAPRCGDDDITLVWHADAEANKTFAPFHPPNCAGERVVLNNMEAIRIIGDIYPVSHNRGVDITRRSSSQGVSIKFNGGVGES